MAEYRPRIADSILNQRLTSVGAVVLEGARATGKTWTGMQVSADVIRVDQILTEQPGVAEHPEVLIRPVVPLLLDEWQVLPSLWNLVRREVDARQSVGQFILTGSALPTDDVTRHSGAGRFSRIRIRPLTLFESGISKGKIRLRELLHAIPTIGDSSNLDLDALITLLLSGGWPATLLMKEKDKIAWVRDYVAESARIDVAMIGTTRKSRDPLKIARTLRSIARSISGSPSVNTIVQDVSGTDGSISRAAVDSYLDALRRTMLIEEVPAWQPHLRSSTALRSSSKLYFVDPSISPAVLKLTHTKLKSDLNYVGQVFENLVMRDLLVYAQACDANVSYYRDENGLEVDAVIEGEDGAWIAIEIKLGQTYLDDAAKSLTKFSKIVDTSKMGKPKALVIITSKGLAYTRPDGIHVVPIDVLGP